MALPTLSALNEADLDLVREASPVREAEVMSSFSELLPPLFTFSGNIDSPF